MLAAEISTDPVLLGYAPLAAARRDAEIAALMNAPRGTRLSARFVNARTVMAEVGLTGAVIIAKMAAFADGAPAASEPQIVGLLRLNVALAMRYVHTAEGVDIGHPNTQGLLDALAQIGVLTQADADALKTLGYVPSSRAHELLGRSVRHDEISAALNAQDIEQ